MARHRIMDLTDVRKDVCSGGADFDASIDPMHLAQVAADAYEAGKFDEHKRLLAAIPPVILGKTKYRVVAGGRHGLELAGPRGGWKSFVRSLKDPTQWSLNSVGSNSVWYKRNPDFTFTKI